MLATVLKRQGRIMCMCAVNQLLLLHACFRKTNISFMEAGARDSINHSCVIANNVFKKVFNVCACLTMKSHLKWDFY